MPLRSRAETARMRKEALNRRIGAYSRVFNVRNADARIVLEDMARFCRAGVSTFNPDPRLSAMLDGRREVWLRIQQHTQLDNETVWRLVEPLLSKEIGA